MFFLRLSSSNLRVLLVAVVLLAALSATLMPVHGSYYLDDLPGPVADVGSSDNAFGLAHISAVEDQAGTYGATRYQKARGAGASWNRWVFYWHEIESTPGAANYAPQETVVTQDVANGYRYKIDAILMGSPSWATTAEASVAETGPPPPRAGQRRYDASVATSIYGGPSSVTYPPQNLALSVFADGTDLPATGKAVNQQNYWARFVYNTVSRFKDRIRHWEIWNEPDYLPSSASGWYGFWNGSADQYYRLLKVAYLAAKAADPSAVIVMGGMAYWPEIEHQKQTPLTFLRRVLGLASADALGATNNRFFDVSAWHWYNRSNLSYYKTRDVRAALNSYGLTRPIWINETGMPAWNDPARPPSGGNQPYFGSGTQTEQASFLMQTFAYGFAAGVERIWAFQAYDDGNDEAFGLVRNNGTMRPAYNAYELISRYLDGAYSVGLAQQGSASIVSAQTTSGNPVVALWNNSPTQTNVAVAARAASATLIEQPTETNPAGVQRTVYPSGGQYVLALPAATNNNGVSSSDYIVGGLVRVLVETSPSSPSAPLTPTGLVGNGRFEQDFNGWTLSGYVPALVRESSSGKHVVLGADYQEQPGLGGANSTLSQSIALPSNAASLNLKLSYLLSTAQPNPADLNNPYSYDKFEVLLIDATGTRRDLLTDWTGKSSWTEVALDLRNYRGQTVNLIFNLWQSAATTTYPTTVYLDDVVLWPFEATLSGTRRNAT